jgi:hypothetical protein
MTHNYRQNYVPPRTTFLQKFLFVMAHVLTWALAAGIGILLSIPF